jgi:murein DD-endopeptidase MepM/ murein hydrolase activator NlpD
LKLSDKTKGEVAFADLRLTGSVVWAGIHQRNKELTSSKGILKTYNLQGGVISEKVHSTREAPPPARLNYEYKSGEVPWPFKPFDSPAKAWNSYLQLSSSSDGSTSGAYLHQGFDMDVPSNIETYPVVDGYVKAVLTLGGDIYWRVAVSDIQTADSSEAWLYAHLDQNSITVKSGDQVKQGVTLLGKVIPWSGLPGGHLHFSRIKSKGTTWNGSWRNCANPMFYLRPHGDTRKPGILFADGTSKFAYSTNDGSGTPTYLKPDNLSGSIDIIVKVSDTCGQSTWNQAATSIFYWIKDSKTGNIVFPRTLVFVRGQGMPDYSGSLYNDLAPIMHRIDSKFPVKGWFTHERIYAHVITNSHGDTDIAVADKSKALDTKKFNDGTYWIVVEVGDAAGNITIDSQEVSFKNGISGTVETTQQPVTAFALNRIFPVSPTVMAINFQTPKVSSVTITIFDLSGKKIKTLVDNVLYAYGTHTILWNGANTTGATVHTGTYLIVMNTEKYSFVKKLLYY